MSLSDALARRRDVVRDREAGFTLIELLVVVIIIGILAAIAIPVYIGVQNNAKDASVKSDLVNQKTALVALGTDKNGAVPAGIGATGATTDTPSVDLTKYGWSRSLNMSSFAYSTTTGGGAFPTWCILATSSTGNKFSITSNTSVAGGTSTSACPASY